MRRRSFLVLTGAAAFAAPLRGFAQQVQTPRVMVLFNFADEKDPAALQRQKWLEDDLRAKGWVKGSNIQLDYRFDATIPAKFDAYAVEMRTAPPAAILVNSALSVGLAATFTKSIPIIVFGGTDPVVLGFSSSYARPDGNVTGFPILTYSLAAKWLELLVDLAPSVKKVGYLYHPQDPPIFPGYLSVASSAAMPLGIEVTGHPVNSDAEIAAAIAMTAEGGHGGLVFQNDSFMIAHRAEFISAALRHKLPSVGGYEPLADDGGLASYIASSEALLKGVAGYVDAILRGAKVNELPIQPPNVLDLVVNLKTAKSIGITVHRDFLVRAVRVIE